MSDGFKLTMEERFRLLGMLPLEGDYTTLKILRKLRETLAPDERENEEYAFQQEYRCSFMDYTEKGRREQCEYTEIAPMPPTCLIHDRRCIPNGRLFWREEVSDKEKAIWLGNKARAMIVSALQDLCDNKKLREEDRTVALYEKFVKVEEDDED